MFTEINQSINDWDNEQVVFFFGAGASKPEGGIITNQLLEKSFNRFSNDDRVIMVKKYLKDIYRNECNDSNIPTFEEILGPIDIALQKQENMSIKWDVEYLSLLRDNLIYCICKLLNENLQSPKGYHNDFIEELLVKHPDRLNKYSFVSLNYDILLDNALIKRRNRKSPNIDIDYGIKFRKETHTRCRQQNVNNRHIPSQKTVPLLKLHGSLNWIYCPTCNSIKLTPRKKGVMNIYTKSEPCDSDFCKEPSMQRPIVVPPTFTKSYENPFLVSIWCQAEKVFQKATRVYFIGYSMPESDIHIQYLLKKSLFRQDGNSPRIIIINPETKNGDLHNRYRRLFGEVEYHPIGFENFAHNLTNYL